MSTNQTNVNSFNRARRDYHAVGKCIPKKDSSQLLLGKPVFTDDITPRDALVIKLLRSPYANAIVEDVKTDIALKVPGMVAVYTWEDVPKKRFSIAGQTFPEPSPYDRLILDRHVRSVGDAVAIVVGESEKAVDKALNMIKVKYTILEPVLDFRKSLDNKVLVHPEDDWSSSINTGDVKRNLIHHEEDEHGNVEKILSECDEIIEHTTRIPAISLMFCSIAESVNGIFFRRTLRTIPSSDFTRVLMDSIGLRSYSRENCSFNTLNFVSTSMIAHL